MFGKRAHNGELADAEQGLEGALNEMDCIVRDPTASPSVLRSVGRALIRLVRSKQHISKARSIAGNCSSGEREE